jgi:RHS repeat-associated protein
MTVSGQPTVYYSYDANGRLTEVNTEINGVPSSFTISYDSIGRKTSTILPNGVTSDYTYDNASRLLNLEHLNPAQAILESLSYTYDPNGNRTSMDRPAVNLPSPNPVNSTSYNEANQMLTFDPSAGSAWNMIYDENGNMISLTNTCGTTNYTWDARNRLVGINGFDTQCSPLSASFKYDALGRRIEKTINGRTIQYLYDGIDIVQEIENGIPSVNYIRTLNVDEPLARIKADGTVRYYQMDALGSIIALTDENGNITTTYSYDPFGNTIISGELSDNPFQYTGRENDGTGLYYYRARYYSPELQRFISEDPIGSLGDKNYYVYAGNNPINYIDPLGLEKKKDKCEEDKCTYYYCNIYFVLEVWDCSILYTNEKAREECIKKAKEHKKTCCETGTYPAPY